MKKDPKTNLHVWPRNGKQAPGPTMKFPIRFDQFRITKEHEARLREMKAVTGKPMAQILREGIDDQYYKFLLNSDQNH